MTLLKKNNISVIIHTLNEENNIRNCLESVKWADEIIIIDMYSDDKTLEIAGSYTDKIFMHERTNMVEPARQFGIDQATKDWVLIVDADELISVQLCLSLIDIVKSNQFDAVIIPIRGYFLGFRLSEVTYHNRFFKKGYAIWPPTLHAIPQFLPQTRLAKLTNHDQAMIHFTCIDDTQYFKKLERYTTIEAKQFMNENFKDVFKVIYDSLATSPEGLAAQIYSTLRELDLQLSIIKYLQMQEFGSEDIPSCISKKYKEIAERMIKGYQDYATYSRIEPFRA